MTQDGDYTPTIGVVEITGDTGGYTATESNRIFSEMMSRITKGCIEKGAVSIGHIKANLMSGDEMSSLSCTTDDGNVRARSLFIMPVKEYRIVMNVIVYGIDYVVMHRIISDALSMIPGSKTVKIRNTSIACEKPCDDPNCTDPNHVHLFRFC